MRKVTRKQKIAALRTNAVTYPHWGIGWLKVAGGGKLGKRVARSPIGFGRLTRPELATVPHNDRTGTPRGGLGRHAIDGLTPRGR